MCIPVAKAQLENFSLISKDMRPHVVPEYLPTFRHLPPKGHGRFGRRSRPSTITPNKA